jgi:hypothetical protein
VSWIFRRVPCIRQARIMVEVEAGPARFGRYRKPMGGVRERQKGASLTRPVVQAMGLFPSGR